VSEDKFRVSWEADDGYAGGSRPHSFTVRADEVADFDDVDAAMEYLTRERLDEEFREKIRPYVSDAAKVRAWVESVFAARAAEEKYE
jgi:hypothetical protein